jgi:cell division protein FtsL
VKPFLSVFILISIIFSVVFVKMENRRLGYELLKVARVKKSVESQMRDRQMALAKLTRPDRVESLAQELLDLKKIESKQVIPMMSRQLSRLD